MNISIDQLQEKIKYNNLNIIDIRNEYSYNKNHIIGAINIPYNLLIQEPEKYINKQETYYIYCQSGHTSNKVVNILNNSGYQTFNVVGGFNNYLLWK